MERHTSSPEGAEFRNKELHEGMIPTYKVHKPKYFSLLSMGKMCINGSSNAHSILRWKTWLIQKTANNILLSR